MKREGTDSPHPRLARAGEIVQSGPLNHLDRAREAFVSSAWRDAYEAFLLADAAAELVGEDLNRLATAAYLVGRDSDFLQITERSHRAHVEANRAERAARDTFWIAIVSLLRGETAQANGWAARGERLICDRDCAERGYLSIHGVEQQLRRGELDAACAQSMANVALGLQFDDMDLVAMARHQQGRAELELGRLPEGLKLLDEVMLAAVSGELSPILTGLMYCSVIDACRGVYDWSRAREWTAALSKWCDRQGGLVAFTDVCRVHRAEILRLQGSWQHAIDEACRVCDRGEHAARPPPGVAYYEQGEVHRLRGEPGEAEQAYRAASRRGFDPQPGLALLRLAQGRTDAAAAAIRRLARASGSAAGRGRFLPAYAEIMLAIGEIDEARHACEELEALCAGRTTEWLLAQSLQARGALCLQQEDACAALAHLRDAFERWERLGVPYEAARVRALVASACEILGDAEAGMLERDAARVSFEKLGARSELERLSRERKREFAAGTLSAREVEVLRLVTQGLTNKSIANKLGLSERTIDRHVGNILGKLNVTSRVGATAYAIAHHLV